jgi:hypothetical protein
MSTRTGNERLDALLERFARENPGCNKSGDCQLVAERFTELARAEGFEAFDSCEHHEASPFPAPAMAKYPHMIGYEKPEELIWDTHYLTLVREGDEIYTIDFTAGQFGYGEWPLVQRMISPGGWEPYVNEWGNQDVRHFAPAWERDFVRPELSGMDSQAGEIVAEDTSLGL